MICPMIWYEYYDMIQYTSPTYEIVPIKGPSFKHANSISPKYNS